MKKLQGIVSELYTPVQKVEAKPEAIAVPFKSVKFHDVYVPSTTYKTNFSMIDKKPTLKKKTATFIIGFCAAAVLISFSVLGVVKFAGGYNSLSDNIEYVTISVERGDTFWDLVREHNPEYTGDIRELVYYADEKNHGSLIAGHMAQIPILKK